MTETDIDTPTALQSRESEAKLPWESIDPDEQPTQRVGPFASTAPNAVEAEKARPAFSPTPGKKLTRRPAALLACTEEAEEELAAHAFFSDEKITAQTFPSPLPPSDREPLGAERLADIASAAASPAVDAAETPALTALAPAPSPNADRFAEADAPGVAPAAVAPAAPANEPPAMDETPWATIDEAPVAAAVSPEAPAAMAPRAFTLSEEIEAPGEAEPAPALVSRALPNDAVVETGITFSTSDMLAASALELATLAESFAPEEAEPGGDATILVRLPDEEAAPFAVTAPRPATAVAYDLDAELAAPAVSAGGGWTIPLMCLGIGLIACCMVIPQGEANRRLRYEQASLVADFDHVKKQVEVNNEFLTKVMDDPTLAERLASRQMKTIRKGQRVVALRNVSADADMSPFTLTHVAPPAALPAYKPKVGTIANLCNDARSRLYLLGAALSMVAFGLVMGFGSDARRAIQPEPVRQR